MRLTKCVACATLALILSASVVAQSQVRYDDNRVVRVYPADDHELQLVRALTDDVWSHHEDHAPLDIRVTPSQLDALKLSGIPFTTLIDNLQALIDAETASPAIAGGSPWDGFMTLTEVNAFMDQLAQQRPDLVQISVIGRTAGGRDIRAMRICGTQADRPAVLYHGCQHAREWITVPIVLYAAQHLVQGYDADFRVRALVDRAAWYLVPVANPDGYAYTWSTDRLWRKNRRVIAGGAGVDLNRNWAYGWGGPGSSGSVGDDTYRGPSAFSEAETQALRNLMLANPFFVAHIDLHSYSQLVMYPWGTSATPIPNAAEFDSLSRRLVDTIRGVHATPFGFGSTYTTLYPSSGTACDWTYSQGGMLPFSIEVRDTGATGFVLPPAQILPSCEEVWPALEELTEYATEDVRAAFNNKPERIAPGVPLTLSFRVNPARKTPTGLVSVYGRASQLAAFQTLDAQLDLDGNWNVTLPAGQCGQAVEFYLEVSTTDGGIAQLPAGAPFMGYRIPVESESPLFADNFEFDAGWTIGAPLNGGWQRGEPVGTTYLSAPAAPAEDNPFGVGTKCLYTGTSTSSDPTAADVDTPVVVISPHLPMSGDDVELSYWRWFVTRDSGGLTAGELEFAVSADQQNWVTLERVGHTAQWERAKFRLSQYLPIAPSGFYLRVTATEWRTAVTEAALDDVLVTAISCAPQILTGDLNCDGSVNNFDIDAFVLRLVDESAYRTAYPMCNEMNGDANHDGIVNNFDIDAFVHLILGV